MQPLIAVDALKSTGSLAGQMGVFVGIQQMEYVRLSTPHRSMGAFTATASPFSVAAGRISFHYGLKGAPKCFA